MALYISPIFNLRYSLYRILETFYIMILPGMALATILTFVYQISEKACCLKGCECCSTCCCPFTQRSVHSTDEGQQKIKTQRRSNSQEQGFEMNEVV